jgi:GNAT superfamily N-acetyltransferase
MDITIRPMRADEIGFAIEQAAREGWNPGLHDAESFRAADPEGFLVAEHDGQPVGCISAVSYDRRFGFIGLYIVVPDWRGRGIGRRLWNEAMTRLAGQVVGLDGVPAQQANYRRSGFELAWNNVRFAGLARAREGSEGAQLRPLAEVDFDTLCDDDRRIFPAARAAFLRCWIALPDTHALAWIEHGRLAGWGVIRRCRQGHKIGPLVADNPLIAKALFAALCHRVPAGDTVFLDVPMPNAPALALAQSHALEAVFETARMYAGGTAPAIELERVFGITSFELG